MSEVLPNAERIDPFLKNLHQTRGNPNDPRQRSVNYQAKFWPFGPQPAFCNTWGPEEIYNYRCRIEIHVTLQYPENMREHQLKALDQLTLETWGWN